MKTHFRLFGFCVVVAALSACGYSKNPPNEFNVVKSPPLILPPDYNLRPPGKGTAPDTTPLLVLQPPTGAPPDKAEQLLLEKAARGGTYGDGVREVLDNERRGTVSQPTQVVDELVKDAEPKTE